MVVGGHVIKRLIQGWKASSPPGVVAAARREGASSAHASQVAPLNLTVRLWQPGDTDRINAFYNDPAIRPSAGDSGNVPRTARQWQWEFETPAAGSPRYVLAFDGGRLIGLQGCIPILLRCDGQPMKSGKSEDTLVHPDYRGLGVGDRMYECLFEAARGDGVELIWGFTTTAVNLLRRNGFVFLAPFEVVQVDVAKASAHCAKHGAAVSAVDVVDMKRTDAACDAFASEFAASVGGLSIDLSARYLQWRLLDNPIRPYHVLAAVRQGRMVGLAAFKREPGRLAYVSELAVIPTESASMSDIIQSLLMAGLDRLRAEGYTSLQARPAGPHPYNQTVCEILADRGFEPIPGRNLSQFAVRPLRDLPMTVQNAGRWRLSEIMREF